MELREALHRRRKRCERFTDRPLEPAVLQQLIRDTAWSLGAWSLRPWHFIVVESPDQKRALRKAAFDQELVERAPTLIAAVGNTLDCDRMARDILERLERGVLWRGNEVMYRKVARKLDLDPDYRQALVVQAAYVAVEHLSLLAAERGLGTANINWFDETEVRKVLDLPDYARLATILAIGRPAQEEMAGPPPPSESVDLTHLAFRNRFGVPYPFESSDP